MASGGHCLQEKDGESIPLEEETAAAERLDADADHLQPNSEQEAQLGDPSTAEDQQGWHEHDVQLEAPAARESTSEQAAEGRQATEGQHQEQTHGTVTLSDDRHDAIQPEAEIPVREGTSEAEDTSLRDIEEEAASASAGQTPEGPEEDALPSEQAPPKAELHTETFSRGDVLEPDLDPREQVIPHSNTLNFLVIGSSLLCKSI